MRKKSMTFVALFLALFSILKPLSVFAAEVTFGQIQDELARAQKELDANNQSISKNENQIIANNATIQELKKKMQEMSDEAQSLQQEIADAAVEIEEKKKETKNLLAYLQMSGGENVYLEYVFGGDTITDIIYRFSIVEQMTEYNENIIKELEDLIVKNENRKTELNKKQEEFEKRTENLNAEINKLTSSISKLGELSPGLEQEVASKKQLVSYYKSQGCSKRSDVIGKDCAVTSTNAYFSRPIKTGYITSFVGYRWGSLHRGLDMGSPLGRNTPLYSIGNGVIKSIWEDKNHAKCVTVQYRGRDGQYYSAIYAHLSRYGNIKEGQNVTSNTILGYMGDTGLAYGVHLHLEVFPCRIYEDRECINWYSYVNFAQKMFNQGFKGAESVISFPNRTYQYWYTK